MAGRGSAIGDDTEAWTFERTLKERAVEEAVNLYWHRPVAYRLLRPFERADWLTPDRITLLAGLSGVAAGIACLRAGEHGAYWFAVGSALLLTSVVLDCADGMLARLRGTSSHMGMLLDGLADYVVGLSAWYGLSDGVCSRLRSPWAWPFSVLILSSTIVHVGLYDHYKNRYLSRLAPRHPAARTSGNPGVLEQMLEAFHRVVYRSLPAAVAGSALPSRTSVVPAEDSHQLHARPMRVAAYLGLGTHLSITYLAALLAVFSPVAALVVGTLSIGVVLNLVALVAVWSWRRAERALEDCRPTGPSGTS